MRILHIVWNFYPNTAYTNHTKATVCGFRESGAWCDVYSIKPLREPDEMALNHKFTGVTSFVATAAGMLYNICNLCRVAKNYDVIYCTICEKFITKRLLSFAKTNNKIIVHERTEYPDVFIPVDSRKMRDYCDLVRQFDKVFVISSYIKQFFIQRGVDESKLQVYPMIVDPHRFDGIKKKDVGYRYIAYCGNLQNSKDGVSDLMEAYATSKYARKAYKLVLIGKSPIGTDMAVYDKIISKYQLGESVVFQGEVQRDEMPQILKNADILALCRPDNHQAEGGFPTKVGEYLSTANPILVTAVGDMELYIRDGVNGYISEAGDVAMFRNKLDYITTHYEEAQSVGAKGQELVFSSFNYLVQTNIVLGTLEKLNQ